MGYSRKDVEKSKMNAKKFVRYQEGAEKYSLGLTKFQELAKEAKAVYKIDKVALVNCEILNAIQNPFIFCNQSHKLYIAKFGRANSELDFLLHNKYTVDVEG